LDAIVIIIVNYTHPIDLEPMRLWPHHPFHY